MEVPQVNRRKTNYLPLIFHNIVFWIFLSDAFYHVFYAKMPSKGTYAGEYKYLTIWCLFIQILYFGFATLTDLAINFNKKFKYRFQKYRDYFYTTLAFPIGAAVSLLFWILYGIDRELVYPAYLDKLIPSWHNHILHTAPIIFLIMDSYICPFKYKPFKQRCQYLLFFIALYYIWLIWIRVVGELWVYPIFYVLSPFQIVLFLLSIISFFFILLFVGEKINTLIWYNKRHNNKEI